MFYEGTAKNLKLFGQPLHQPRALGVVLSRPREGTEVRL